MTMTSVEQWDIFALTLPGPGEGNPFVDVTWGATFHHQHRAVAVDGFYDGEGRYRVRLMPDTPGEWRYRTHSSAAALDGQEGRFTCTPARAGNHGPVAVRNTYHFGYADGTPHYSVGTTCYAWAHQGDALEEQTLTTLAQAPFNKMRMCVFPKDYSYNRNEPLYYPFARQANGSWDWTRFDPAFWAHFERRVGQLRDLGIEADLILFHPYDRWGFSKMDAATDDRYLRYAVARLAAYRNVWWSMANEYDIMREKSMADWDRFFRIVQESDPYQHPRGIHNCRGFYDHTKPWVTHQSIQHSDLARVSEWRNACRKPVVVDECCYEGNIEQGWGNISARELVHRFWEGTARGGYVGHGETYLHPQDILWWSKGGVLHGDSPARLAFLRRILEEGPALGLEPLAGVARNVPCVGAAGEYYLCYTGVHQPAVLPFTLPAAGRYAVEIIDPWEMTITPQPETVSGACVIHLPGIPYQAVRLRRVG